MIENRVKSKSYSLTIATNGIGYDFLCPFCSQVYLFNFLATNQGLNKNCPCGALLLQKGLAVKSISGKGGCCG